MGHIAHFKAGATGQLRAHIDRTRGDRAKYGNEEIDPKKSHLNFHPVGEVDGNNAIKVFSKYAEKIGQHRKKTDTIMTSVIFHLPERYLSKPKAWQDEFFTNVHKFLSKQFEVDLKTNGKAVCSNLIASTVHYDETTPHIHFAFVPVVKQSFERKYKDRNGEERTTTVKAGSISSRYVTTRLVLQRLHNDLDKYLSKELKGYNGGILLDTDEKIEKSLILDAKDLKQAPKDYLEQARKLSRGLLFLKAKSELLQKEKELDAKEQNYLKNWEMLKKYQNTLKTKEISLNEREKELTTRLDEKRTLEQKYRDMVQKRDELLNRVNNTVGREQYDDLRKQLNQSKADYTTAQKQVDNMAVTIYEFMSTLPSSVVNEVNTHLKKSNYGIDFLNAYKLGKMLAQEVQKPKQIKLPERAKGFEPTR